MNRWRRLKRSNIHVPHNGQLGMKSTFIFIKIGNASSSYGRFIRFA